MLGGIPEPNQNAEFEYYIIPASVMSKKIQEDYEKWLATPSQKNQAHNETSVRTVLLPPPKSINGWSVKRYKNRWDLIEKKLI